MIRTENLLVCLLAVVCMAGSQFAYAATMTGPTVNVEVSSAEGSGTWSTADLGEWVGENYSWELAAPVSIMDDSGTVELAVVESATITAVADPVLNFAFNVQAGGADTNFMLSPAQLNFPAIPLPIARASAGIIGIDLNGNGVTITGDYAGNTKSFRADTNGTVPTGTLFKELVDNGSAGSFSNFSSEEDFPTTAGVLTPIAGPVSSMHSEFSFTLSAGDLAVGTSVFVVEPIPEPATAILAVVFGAVALGAVRRRQGR